MFHDILFAGSGWLIGCFTPAVGRIVKAWITKKLTAAETTVKADIKKL